jgi:hypothetical protein
MSESLRGIAAEAEGAAPSIEDVCALAACEGKEECESEVGVESNGWQDLPDHTFPAAGNGLDAGEPENAQDRNPDIWLYRKRTTALLRRYMRFSLEAGRLPSVIGREFFRAKITSYTSTTFEDRVIFVHDVETCLERFDPFDQQIIARIVLQEHDHERAAGLLQCTRKTIERRMPELLDEMSEEFLRVGLLEELPKKQRAQLANAFLA